MSEIKNKLVEFIIPTYNRKEPLKSMLASLVAQTDNDWAASVIIDNMISSEETFASAEICNSFKDKRIKVSFTDHRYNDWGHTPREMGKQASKADYIIMTGDDNYYTPNFVYELRKASELNPGMIYWDMVHSHYDYAYFKCTPAFNQIDMGAFATRNDLAKQIKLNTSYAADGEFVQKFVQKFGIKTTYKINKVLFVHN